MQNYFKMYDKLSGMTGTAETEAGEFGSTYNLAVVPIPTHRVPQRLDQPDVIYKNEQVKFTAIIDDVLLRREKGQPVLIGTASVAKSEILSAMMTRRGIPHEVLNAKQHFREAEVVAQAGRLGAVTVATNMAGRGVDILLGGNAELLAQREVLSRGLDLASEEGQAAYLEALNVATAQCELEGEQVRDAGGLYVLGSERHESRRIDNQLRGRAGRQGDAGESRFFLSLEDELLRLFATGALSWVMGRTLPDDQPIEAKMVSKAIERAQNTVEGRNAEIRKDVLKYDAVMNEQRKVIYGWRLRIMDGENLEERTTELLEETAEALVKQCCPGDYPEAWDVEQLLVELHQYYPTRFSVEDLGQASSQAQVIDSVVEEALDYYERHAEELPGGVETARMIERDIMLQIIDQRWQEHLAEMDYLREGINLRAVAQQDPLVAWQREGFSMFGTMIEAIEDDYLRYVLHVEAAPDDAAEVDLNRAVYVAADDPVSDSSMLAQLAPDGGQMIDATEKPQAPFNPADFDAVIQPIVKAPEEKLGRNEPCFCGSGRKFKFCHGAAGR